MAANDQDKKPKKHNPTNSDQSQTVQEDTGCCGGVCGCECC